MACNSCADNLFRQKLGRCRTCMWLNIMLLIGSAIGWLIRYQYAPKQVGTIALLFTLVASALLMALHIGAYLYYRSQGIKKPTESIAREGKARLK